MQSQVTAVPTAIHCLGLQVLLVFTPGSVVWVFRKIDDPYFAILPGDL